MLSANHWLVLPAEGRDWTEQTHEGDITEKQTKEKPPGKAGAAGAGA